MFGDADLRCFFRDFGVPVVFNGVSTYPDGETIKGNLNQPGKDDPFGDVTRVSDQDFCVELPYNAFSPMPVSENVIQVNGARYKVRSVDPMSDGGIVEIKLRVLK